jgi:hypothetical protein
MEVPASEDGKLCRNIGPLMHTDPDASYPCLCQTVESQDPLSLHFPSSPRHLPQTTS